MFGFRLRSPRVILEQDLSFEILRFRIPTASSLNAVKDLGGDAPLKNDGEGQGAVKDLGENSTQNDTRCVTQKSIE